MTKVHNLSASLFYHILISTENDGAHTLIRELLETNMTVIIMSSMKHLGENQCPGVKI